MAFRYVCQDISSITSPLAESRELFKMPVQHLELQQVRHWQMDRVETIEVEVQYASEDELDATIKTFADKNTCKWWFLCALTILTAFKAPFIMSPQSVFTSLQEALRNGSRPDRKFAGGSAQWMKTISQCNTPGSTSQFLEKSAS